MVNLMQVVGFKVRPARHVKVCLLKPGVGPCRKARGSHALFRYIGAIPLTGARLRLDAIRNSRLRCGTESDNKFFFVFPRSVPSHNSTIHLFLHRLVCG